MAEISFLNFPKLVLNLQLLLPTPLVPYLSLEVLQYHQITGAVLQKDASSMDVVKEHEEQQVCALAMVGDKDVKSQHATKVQKAEQLTAKHMEEGKGVNTSGAPKALRGRLITA